MLHTSFLASANKENVKGLWLDQGLRTYTEKNLEYIYWNYVVVDDCVAGLEWKGSYSELLVKFTKVSNRQEMFEYMNKPEFQKYLNKPVKVLDVHWIDTEFEPSDWWWLASPYLSANPSCLEAGKTRSANMRGIYAEIITYPYDFGSKEDVYITVDPWHEEFVMVW